MSLASPGGAGATQQEKSVGAGGGTLEAGGAKVAIPAGALPGDTKVSVRKLAIDDVPGINQLGPAMLFDLEANVAEKKNVVADHPDVVKRLTELAEKARADLGDEDRAGKNQRPAGHEPKPAPLTLPSPPPRGRG